MKKNILPADFIVRNCNYLFSGYAGINAVKELKTKNEELKKQFTDLAERVRALGKKEIK